LQQSKSFLCDAFQTTSFQSCFSPSSISLTHMICNTYLETDENSFLSYLF
jgi:hypothetical protein